MFYKDLFRDNRMKIKISKAIKRQDESNRQRCEYIVSNDKPQR